METELQALEIRLDGMEERVEGLAGCIRKLNKAMTQLQDCFVASRLNDQVEKEKREAFREQLITWMKRLDKQHQSTEDYSFPGESTVEGNGIDDPHQPLQQIKLPMFNGSDPRGWIVRAETRLYVYQIPPEMRVRLAEKSMEGATIYWYSMLLDIYPNLTWEQFKMEMMRRYNSNHSPNSYEVFADLPQAKNVEGNIGICEDVAATTLGQSKKHHNRILIEEMENENKGKLRVYLPEESVVAMKPTCSLESLLQIEEGESLQQFLVNEEGTKTIQETQAGWNGSGYVGLLDHLPSPIPGPTQNNSFTHLPAHQQQTFSPSDKLHRWGQTRQGVRQGTKTEWKERRRKGLCFLRRIAALEVLKNSNGETAEMEECHEELHSIKFIGTTNGISTLMPVNRGTKPIFIFPQLLLVLGNQQGVPAFTVPQPDEAMSVLEEKAYKLDVPLQVVPLLDSKLLNGLKLGLEGVHQFLNAGLAVALCWKWLERTGHLGASYLEQTSCLPEQFIKGLTTACLQGRAQIVPDRFINSESDGDLVFYLDGAHSPESMETCARWFSIAIKDESLGTLNFPSDKNSESMVELVKKNHDRRSRKNLMQILLFNCMSVRDPQLLLPRLMKSCVGHGVYFKKALFVIRIAFFWRTSLNDSTAPSQQYYFDHFEVHPINITANFIPGDSYSSYVLAQEALRSLLHSVVKVPPIKNIVVELNGVLVTHALITMRNLFIRCAQNYYWYAMRAIYIAKGSPLLSPAFVSIFDDLASFYLNVFFDPSRGLVNLPGVTSGTFKFLSRCINGKGLSGIRQYFSDLERTLKTVGSNVLFAAVTEISDYVLKGAEVSGLDGMVSGFHQGILKLAMEPSLLGTALMEGGPDRKIKIDRSPGISTSVLRTRLFPPGGNDGDNATSPGIQTRGPPYDKGKCKRHEGWHKE